MEGNNANSSWCPMAFTYRASSCSTARSSFAIFVSSGPLICRGYGFPEGLLHGGGNDMRPEAIAFGGVKNGPVGGVHGDSESVRADRIAALAVLTADVNPLSAVMLRTLSKLAVARRAIQGAATASVVAGGPGSPRTFAAGTCGASFRALDLDLPVAWRLRTLPRFGSVCASVRTKSCVLATRDATHNPKVASSNLAPATTQPPRFQYLGGFSFLAGALRALHSLGMGRAARARYPEGWDASRPRIARETPSTPCSIR